MFANRSRYPHLHTLALDGVFSRSSVFHAAPPLSAGSLEQLSENEYSFKLKTPWTDGTTHLDGVGIPSDPPILKPARPPPQTELDWDDDLSA